MVKVLSDLYRSGMSVFSICDAMVITKNPDRTAMSRILAALEKKGVLKRLRKGIYSLPEYNIYEFGNKIITPSYLTMESVLREEGVIFQVDNVITYASYQTRRLFWEEEIVFHYRKMKQEILFDNRGKIYRGGYTRASLERAFLDMCYVDKWRTYENITPIDKNKVKKLLPIYNNAALVERVSTILNL